MKFTCTHTNLIRALQSIELVVGKQGRLPILSNILFEVESGRVRLLATNLEIGVTATLGAKVESVGTVALPAKLLTNFVQNLNTQSVATISQEGSRVLVGNESDEIRINCVESKDFPLIPEFSGEYAVKIEGEKLAVALRKVLFAVSLNESRMELTGVFLSVSERGVHFAGTDSFRLAEYTLESLVDEKSSLREFLESQGGIILPVDTLQELSRVLSVDSQVEVAFAVAENQVFFEIGGVRIVSRIIQGRYPDYQQILPKEFRQKIPVPKTELVRALKMATNFSQYGSHEVTCRFVADSGVLEVETVSSGVGEQRAKIHLEDGLVEDIQLVFHPRHLLEGVNSLEGEKVWFHVNTKDTPVLVVGEEAGYLYLVMPIRK